MAVPVMVGWLTVGYVYNGDTKRVAAYLPGNYRAVGEYEDAFGKPYVHIEGKDVAGWTMQDYVIPRLASGLMYVDDVHEVYREDFLDPNEDLSRYQS